MKNKKISKKINIQNQLLVRFFVILLGLLVVLSIYENRSFKSYIYRSKAEDLNDRILKLDKDVFDRESGKSDDDNIFETLVNKVKTEDVSVLAIDKNGEIQCKKKSNTIGKVIRLDKSEYLKIINSSNKNAGYKILKDDNDNEQIVVWNLVNIQNDSDNYEKALIQISTLTDAPRQILNEQINMFIITTIFILFLGIIMAYTVSKYTLKPLKEITDKIDNFDIEKVDERIESDTKQYEIIILKNSFNNMLEKVQNARDTEKKIK